MFYILFKRFMFDITNLPTNLANEDIIFKIFALSASRHDPVQSEENNNKIFLVHVVHAEYFHLQPENISFFENNFPSLLLSFFPQKFGWIKLSG